MTFYLIDWFSLSSCRAAQYRSKTVMTSITVSSLAEKIDQKRDICWRPCHSYLFFLHLSVSAALQHFIIIPSNQTFDHLFKNLLPLWCYTSHYAAESSHTCWPKYWTHKGETLRDLAAVIRSKRPSPGDDNDSLNHFTSRHHTLASLPPSLSSPLNDPFKQTQDKSDKKAFQVFFWDVWYVSNSSQDESSDWQKR